MFGAWVILCWEKPLALHDVLERLSVPAVVGVVVLHQLGQRGYPQPPTGIFTFAEQDKVVIAHFRGLPFLHFAAPRMQVLYWV